MPLETGSRFGSYEILELLNSGNDVEAYKATDTAKTAPSQSFHTSPSIGHPR